MLNRREEILRCLAGLEAQQGAPSFEVLVLDGGSTDGTLEACRERAARSSVPIRVVEEPGSVGRRRNRAGQLGRGELVAFTDSDCMPAPRWLAEAVPPFEGDPGLGIVQGVTLPEPGVELGRWSVTQHLPAFTGRYECCNLLVRREALNGSDGFDECVFFGEDTAGGYAILRQGWRAGFAPEAIVHHDVTCPGYSWFLRRGLMYGDLARVLRRYPEMRRDLLWCRVFLRPRSAKLVVALAGLGTRRRGLALMATAPYLAERVPRRRNLVAAGWQFGEALLFDLAVLAGSVRGSLRHRSLLL